MLFVLASTPYPMLSGEPKTSAIAPAILAGGMGAIVYVLALFWGANPEHLDRLLILLAASYAAWSAYHAEPTLSTLQIRPTRLGFLPLILGSIAFPVGWFLQAQVGPRPVVLWWLTAAWVLATAGFILLRGGWSYLHRLAFPLGFVLFALPMPNRILVPLQFALQSATTAVAAWVLPLLGVPVERSGFVLSLPGGDLGVAEACSGVRSVTALTAIAAGVAWWNGFRFPRGIMLVVLSVPVIAAVNAVRVIISGYLQEYAGPDYVRGHWHEGLGIGMILLGLGLILGLAAWMKPRFAATRSRALDTLTDAPFRVAATRIATVGILACAAFGTIAAQLLGTGAEHEVIAAAPLDRIRRQLGRWEGTDVPVPDEVAEMLTADGIFRRIYREAALGYEVHAWVIFWSSRNMVKGYHHPDVCWPNRGFRLIQRDLETVPAGGGHIPITTREFTRDTKRQLILYWTQEGRRVWSAEDEQRMQATGDSHDWLGERLFRRTPPAASGRLVVLVGTEMWGDRSAIREQTVEFAGRLADEVYRLCPWAAPPSGE